MKRLRAIVILCVLVLSLVSFTTSANAATSKTSPNWSGYVAIGSTPGFDYVLSNWIVPTVTCPSSGTTKVLMFVGLGTGGTVNGDSDPLYQAGTQAICVNGRARYSAWWETVGAPDSPPSAVEFGQTVQPGDHIQAVATSGVVQVMNFGSAWPKNEIWKWYAEKKVNNPRNGSYSAECIVERPTNVVPPGTMAQLANFGSVSFPVITKTSYSLPGCQASYDRGKYSFSLAKKGTVVPGVSIQKYNLTSTAYKKSTILAVASNPTSDGSFRVKYARG